MDDAVVVNVPEANRYELRLDGRPIGYADYTRNGDTIAFTHTEVDAELSGKGYGSRLVADALDDARRQGLTVVPVCSFVAHYLDTHPEYQALAR